MKEKISEALNASIVGKTIVGAVIEKQKHPKNFKEAYENMVSLNALVASVEQWSKDKGLDKSDSSKQFLKVVEEVGEVAAALARGDKFKLVDGIGDVIVTLIILAQQNELTLEECLECAYDEIKGRTGKMIDGVFVKSEDLK